MSLPSDVETDSVMDSPAEIQMNMNKLQSKLSSVTQDERFDSGIDSLRSVDSAYCLSFERESSLASINEKTSLTSHLEQLHLSHETRTETQKTETTVEDIDEAYHDECTMSETLDNLEETATIVEYPEQRCTGRLTDDAFDQDQEGDTPLHLAIIHKEVDFAEKFIIFVADPELLNISNDLMQTPLHLSVLTRQQDICRALVLGNAQIDCTDRNGDTPLHIACRLRDEGCIRALTEGISPLERKRGMVPQNRACGVQQLPQNLELRNFEGYTCIHIAGFACSADQLEYLVQLGGDINAPDGKSGRTILHYAVEAGDFSLCQYLIANLGANVNALTFDQCTPLHLAVGRGLKAIMLLLVANGADKDITNFEGERPCDLARDRELMLYMNAGSDDSMYTDIRIQGQY
ncbi:NF-kappa-B inhibitor epsilon-like [Asterias amurensis]|uniref:NF-kappa-B inhibitor epsilon-like n=1 Tax=Asterias amurensis TaxID=7602 RepID=UPI003AB86702